MRIPPNHPFIDGFSIINHPVGVPPFTEPPISIDMIYDITRRIIGFHRLRPAPREPDSEKPLPVKAMEAGNSPSFWSKKKSTGSNLDGYLNMFTLW